LCQQASKESRTVFAVNHLFTGSVGEQIQPRQRRGGRARARCSSPKETSWLEASSAALELIARLPLDEVGCLYLDHTGRPVCPDPAAPDFPKLTRHFGSVKGAWPRIVEP
jgi:hypothetical protein